MNARLKHEHKEARAHLHIHTHAHILKMVRFPLGVMPSNRFQRACYQSRRRAHAIAQTIKKETALRTNKKFIGSPIDGSANMFHCRRRRAKFNPYFLVFIAGGNS